MTSAAKPARMGILVGKKPTSKGLQYIIIENIDDLCRKTRTTLVWSLWIV